MNYYNTPDIPLSQAVNDFISHRGSAVASPVSNPQLQETSHEITKVKPAAH